MDGSCRGAVFLLCSCLIAALLIPPMITADGGAPVIVAIGDGVLSGSTLEDERSRDSQESTLSYLGSMLNVSIVNRIVPGDVSTNMVARFEEDVMALDPDHVILMLSRFDVGRSNISQIKLNYLMMMSDSLANGSKVTLVTMAPTTSHDPFREEMNGWAKNLSLTNVVVVDTVPLLADASGKLSSEYDAGDGQNITAAGYRAIALEIFQGGFEGLPLQCSEGGLEWKDPMVGWAILWALGSASVALYLRNNRFAW